MEFTKMHGAANDFVITMTNGCQRDWPGVAVAMCDRHRGVGADSLILLMPSDKADFSMRVFDRDGSEAETCGNGIRCLAKYIYEKQLTENGNDEISIETVSGVRRIHLDKVDGKITNIRANMGKPMFHKSQIPFDTNSIAGEIVDINHLLTYKTSVEDLELTLHLVSMGNPHAVYFSEYPVEDFPLSRIGPIVEHLPVFPNRVNFEVARAIDHRNIEARVWEKGVGETYACGSGACAITVASKLLGYTGNDVDIILRGGKLSVIWNGTGEVILGGPAETVYEGKWPD